MKSNRNIIFGLLLSSCILGSAIQTSLNTALTPIMEDMQIAAGTAQWLTSLYSLTMGIMVLATAFLIRRFPSRGLYLVFMTLFSIGLFFSAVASSFFMLVVGRILQAMGCGLLMSLTQVIILSLYPEEERGSMMGLYGLAVCAAPILAPTISGVITDLFGWRAIFWGAMVISLFLLIWGLFTMKNITETEMKKFDFPSLLFCAVGFYSVVFGLGNLGKGAMLSTAVLIPLCIGAVTILIFVHRQLSMSEPFLDVRIFRNERFCMSVIISMMMYCTMMAISTLVPLYNQSFRGLNAAASGLITLPGSIITAVISPAAGKWYDKIGANKLLFVGSGLIMTGHLLLCFLGADTPMGMVAVLFAIRQAGIGMMMMTTVTWGMSKLPASAISDGTAIISSLRTVAGAIGSAVFVSIMSLMGENGKSSMLSGFRVAFAGVTLLSLVLFVLVILKAKKLDVQKSSCS